MVAVPGFLHVRTYKLRYMYLRIGLRAVLLRRLANRKKWIPTRQERAGSSALFFVGKDVPACNPGSRFWSVLSVEKPGHEPGFFYLSKFGSWPISELIDAENHAWITSAIRSEAELNLPGPLTSEIDPNRPF